MHKWTRNAIATLDESFDWVPRSIEHEIPGAIERALATGASPPLRYLGAGMSGIVICDSNDVAFKVARRWPGGRSSRLLQEEALWFDFARGLPSIRQHVARVVGYEPSTGVLIRECVGEEGRDAWPANPKRSRRRMELFDRICKVMRPYGFRSPEYKEDSFVYSPKRGPVLVDAGFGSRDLGWANARRARQLLAGAPPRTKYEPGAVIHGLRMDAGDVLPRDVAMRLAVRLERMYD